MSEHEITIHIDRKEYRVDKVEMTGAEIRQLPSPPIGPDYDLYLEVHDGEDRLIADDDEVHLQEGMHFFSTQRHITPGS